MVKVYFIIYAVICLNSVKAYLEFDVYSHAFNIELYDSVLDEDLCKAQLSYIRNNSTMLRAEFLDAGIRTPRGIFKGNFVDLGNYHQCIEISANFEPSDIEGKYCLINVPMTQDDVRLPTFPEWPRKQPEIWPELPEEWPEFQWPELLPNTRQHRDMVRNLQNVWAEATKYSRFLVPDTYSMNKVSENISVANQAFRLAVCLPKACTTKQFIDALLINTTAVGLEYTEEFCRLKNDKPFAPADYVAVGIFGLIIIFTIICTSYDLYYTLKGDPKTASTLGKSFSVYTNTRSLLTFNSTPTTLECLDGIRAISMMWVIVGHTFSTQLRRPFYNRTDFNSWIFSFSAIWLLAAHVTVDTFLMLSGLLIVYTTIGKISRMGLLRNLHLFYLQRLLRMFPVLAAGILLQASLFNHISDGPEWHIVTDKVERCRTYWWSTLTYVQTYLTNNWCINPTWYLAVDVQMHILSPLVLFWVFGKRRSAWIALTLAMLTITVASTTYNYFNEFPAAPGLPTRTDEDTFRYRKYYYINTLTRCSPFLVGMMFGYLLSVYKGKEVYMPKWLVASSWVCSFGISAGVLYSSYPVTLLDWNSPFWDNIINSFSRPAWAACLGWMIFACTHGYGGPINWFLSLRMWKLPARISFAMYIFHYSIIHIFNASSVAPAHFTVVRHLFRFLIDLISSFVLSFIVTLMIDSPISTLIKLVMGAGPKKRRPGKMESREENDFKTVVNK